MKTHTGLLFFLVIVLLTSCVSSSPATPTNLLATLPISTLDPYAGLPVAKITAEADLFSGPGNTGYDVLAILPAGESVTLLGSFGDFIDIYIPSIQSEGFVWNQLVDILPDDLPVLSANDVPWIDGDFITENCMGPFTSISQDGTAVIENYTTGPGWYAMAGAPIQLGTETRLIIQISTQNGNAAVLTLMDTPVEPYADAFVGHRQLEIKFENGGYSIGFIDGRSYDYGYFSIPLPDLGNNPFELIIRGANGSEVEIRDLSGTAKYEFATQGSFFFEGVTAEFPQGIFPNQTMYVNCASNGPTTVTMKAHAMTRAPTGVWVDPPVQLPSLRDLAAAHGIDILVPIEGWRMGDSRYASVVRQQASMSSLIAIVPPIIWTGIDQYNFPFLDALLQYYRSQGWEVKVAIVGGYLEDQPEDLRNSNFTRDEYIDILHRYVSTLVCRYKDQVKVWDIAGEAAGRRVSGADDFWWGKIGPDYIEMSFRWARECDPDGILLFTDSNMDSRRDPEFSAYIDTMLAMVKDMKSRGTPIDAVGIEGHLFLPSDSLVPPTKEGVLKTMQEFGALGVDIYITEMDVTLTSLPGSRDERLKLQAQVYKAMMDACLESGICKGFGIWGIDDDHAWSMCMPDLGCPPNILPEPLLFDNNFNPKPAFYALIQSLQEH